MKSIIQRLDIYRLVNGQNKNWETYDYYASEEDIHDMISFSPVRHGCYQLALCTSGSISVRVDGQVISYEANTFASYIPSTVLETVEVSEDYRCRVVVFDKDFILENSNNIHFLERCALFNTGGIHYMRFNPEDAKTLEAHFINIRKKMEDKNHFFRRDIIRCMVIILLNEIEDIYLKTHTRTNIDLTRNSKDHMLSEFQEALRKHFYTERKVSFYAEELNISPERLSIILKERTGKTAKEHIEELVLSEAKILLRMGKYNVSEVASLLKYENVEEFSRFFKKKMGCSPLSYSKCPINNNCFKN